jgi:hypothetical protein
VCRTMLKIYVHRTVVHEVCRNVCTQKHKRLHHDGIVPLKSVLLDLFDFLRLCFLTCDYFRV